ncbi:MAG: FtsX-like permease family protein, partial [Bacteroidetes bacterium]
IVPVAYHISEDWLHWMTVRVRGQDIPGTLDKIEAQWSALAGEATFDPHFLDEDLDALYQEQERLMRISTIFALIAIAIACLGILGLAAFMAQQRTRELGIRKVLGASTFSLMRLLTQDFLWLVLVAAGVAAPIGGWLMYQWLMDFPYRIDLQPLTFVLATALALLIALSTVAGLAWRAAHLNPVEAIRHE